MFTGHGALDTDAAADDHGVQGRGFVHGGIGGDLQTVTGPHLAAVDGQGAPAIQLATGQLVGHAQGSTAEAREISVKLSSSRKPMD
jgi:hypothetical protein